MLTVADAQRRVLENTRPLPPRRHPLIPDALGLVLAEDVVSDLDMPPYDKSMMDGYAVRTADLPQGRGELTVIEEITAGKVPERMIGPGQAARIMTGAPVPEGIDCVVMIERCQLNGDRVRIDDKPPKPGQHILPRGREMRRGEKVLSAGAVLRPQEIGLLATVGRSEVSVTPPPRVSVLSTGDEVVEPTQAPGPGQIRNSNAPMLMAQTLRAKGLAKYLGVARDSLDSLRPLIGRGLGSDILILSGGVSAGKLDLVPGVLTEAGVEAIFHKVEMKPGKPVFFGVRDQEIEGRPQRTLVFGLPGNPVSALVCFELFVRPAMQALMGLPPGPRLSKARLTGEFRHRSDRPTYHPAILEATDGAASVKPVPWFGSPDLRGLTSSNAFLVLAAGEQVYAAGVELDVLMVE